MTADEQYALGQEDALWMQDFPFLRERTADGAAFLLYVTKRRDELHARGQQGDQEAAHKAAFLRGFLSCFD